MCLQPADRDRMRCPAADRGEILIGKAADRRPVGRNEQHLRIPDQFREPTGACWLGTSNRPF